DAGRSRRGRRSRAEPAEQEGRAGVGRRRTGFSSRAPGARAGKSRTQIQNLAAIPTRSRGCQWRARLSGHFAAKCCFQVIYFNPNIFFVPPSETCLEAGVETSRSIRATKLNAWTRQRAVKA